VPVVAGSSKDYNKTGKGRAWRRETCNQCKGRGRYEALHLFNPSSIPPGLPVIGIPTPAGFVWLELTSSEYESTVADPELARQLAVYAAEVLARRLPTAEEHAIE